MYKLSVNKAESYSKMEFVFKSMEEASIFINTILTTSTEKAECLITKEEENE